MLKKENTERRDIYADITNQLITSIEEGPGTLTLPWRRPSGQLLMPVNVLTGKSYNGINVVSLWVAAGLRGYDAPIWGTYRQWSERGAQVRKGEKSSLVVFYKEYESDPNPEDADDNGKRRVVRASYVFNASQVEGFEVPPSQTSLGPIERIEGADRFALNTGADIRHGGDRAFYAPDTDHVQMPDEGLFTGSETLTRSEGYYATLIHELVHWTGPKKRLDRDMSGRFGDQAYAAEELVAEIGAAFLCCELGITQELRIDHAQYLVHWLQLLKGDSKAIFTAAAKASQAVSYLKEGARP